MDRRRVGWHLIAAGCCLALVCALAGGRSAGAGNGADNPGGSAAGDTDVRQASATGPGQIEVGRSRVYVFVGKTGLGHEHAVEGRVKSGQIRLGAAERAGQIIFDMRSFVADTDAARRYIGLHGSTGQSTRRQVTANMLGKSVLDVQRFPTATFQIDSALPAKTGRSGNGELYRLVGRFTLHGVSRPLRVVAQAQRHGELVRLRGRFSMLQSSFGIKPYSRAFGAIGVADRLVVWGDLWLVAE